MSSRNKNFRRIRQTEDDDSPTIATTTTATPKPPTSNTSTTKPPRRLSFAEDEDNEDDESPLSIRPPSSKSLRKKSYSLSSSSHKHTTKTRLPTTTAANSTAISSSNVQPQAGQYTKEKLLELEKSTPTLSRSRPPPPPPSSSEPVVILKGLVKPRDELEEREKDDAEGRFGKMAIDNHNDNEDSSGGLILDQEAINAIRAKRERLRKSRAPAPDFISLDGGSNHGEAQGLSDEEPEFQTRISLFGDKKDAGKKGVFETFDGIETDSSGLRTNSSVLAVEDDEDEENEIWEQEQYRKALGRRIDEGSNVVNNNVSVTKPQTIHQQQSYAYSSASYHMTPSAPIAPVIAGVSRSADVMSISQQSSVACQAMQENIRRLQESHGRTVSSMTRVEENLSAALSNVTALENSLSAAGEKFIFMQKLRDFVSVICDFLQDKAPLLEELEEQMQKLHEDRASAIIERRTADNADEMMEVEAAMSVFTKGGGGGTSEQQSNLPVELDEFGRDKNLQKRMDMKRRIEARKRRKEKADLKRSRSDNVEGESSTDESDTESTSYKSQRQLLLETAAQAFSDASEDFAQLSVVKKRFDSWKKIYASSYQDAYMSLSAPSIFSPYVRLELLKWDPLYEETDFYDMEWHSLLFDYGLLENENDDMAPPDDDLDSNLVPGLVEKVALPILHHQIAHCWDMLSTRETKNAVSATNLVITYVPVSSEALRGLLTVIHTRLSDAIGGLNVPTWSSVVIQSVPNAGRIAAYRFGMSIRLLKNVCLWKDVLALPILEKLAIDELLGEKILPHLRSLVGNIHDALTRTERVIVSLNGVWTGSGAIGGCSTKLQGLVELVLTLGRMLEKKHAAGVSENETSGLARRLKKMLVELNEYDRARVLAKNFQLKEAL